MYTDDNSGSLVPNPGNTDVQQTWARGWYDYTDSSDNTNTTFLVNPELHNGLTGLLGPYLGRNPRFFLCPSDRSTVTIRGRQYSRAFRLDEQLDGRLRLERRQPLPGLPQEFGNEPTLMEFCIY